MAAIVAVDAMGGDHAPAAVVQGALRAARDRSLEIVLVGRATELRGHLPLVPPNLHLLDAPEAIAMEEAPSLAVRQKPRSSIAEGLRLLRREDARAFISFGSTGAVMAASLLILGRIPGIDRPALGALFENGRGSRTLLLDVGANADCRPVYLCQFATMGKAYFEHVLHHGHPSVGLLNVGAERGKGNQFAQEAYELLQRDEPNFIGNVEGLELIAGAADIVVTDGFTGNVAVKVSEGVAHLLTGALRRAVRSKLRYSLAALLMRGAFDALRARIDYQRVGGAPLFGVNGAVLIGHGRADAEAVAAGIRRARLLGESGYVEALRGALAGALPGREGALPADAPAGAADGAGSSAEAARLGPAIAPD